MKPLTFFPLKKLFSLYAFGSPDPGYLGEDIGSASRLAKACVEMLREIQPRGPYFLGGYSFGGLVSLEMATILEGLGEKVALVVMVDTVRWLPPARNNSHLLLDMFETKFAAEEQIEVRIFISHLLLLISGHQPRNFQSSQANYGTL